VKVFELDRQPTQAQLRELQGYLLKLFEQVSFVSLRLGEAD
jgi:hypothetical protein